MATYNVVKTNGQVYTVLSESELDTSTGLSLIGQSFRGYGELVASNFFRLLENMANSVPPTNPVEGQLWWDTTTKILNFFDGSRFKSVTGNSTQNSEPTSPSIGDNWWDTRTDQLKVFTGSVWSVVGPVYEKQHGASGIFSTSIPDNQSTVQLIDEIKVNGSTVAIVSNSDSFVPAVTIPGFTTINRGINVLSTGTFNGTAFNSTRLGGATSDKFLNTDAALTVVNGNVTLTGTRALIAGGLELKTLGGGDKHITALNGGSLVLKTTSGTVTLLANGELRTEVQPTDPTGVANKEYVDNKINSSYNAVPTVILPLVNNAQDIGSTSKRWNRVYGTSTAVLAGDLAERYHSDSSYTAGTVVVFGGTAEVTVSSEYCDHRIAGVVSTEPGFLMGDSHNGLPVALTGKVPCFVVGPINKGDVLVNSHIPGIATSLFHTAQWKPGCVIGKSLETSADTGIKTINIVVGRF